MHYRIGKVIALLLPLVLLPSLELDAQGAGAAAPTLTSLIISTEPRATTPSACLQLLPNEPVSVFAVGLDANGKPFSIPTDSVVHWSGGDGVEVKASGSQSATVTLTKPLRAGVAPLSNRLSWGGKAIGSAVEVSQRVKELPTKFMLAVLKDPGSDRTMDVESMKPGDAITVYLRGTSVDLATMGELFTLPLDVAVGWRTAPSPPLGAEIAITPFGCHGAKIQLVKPPQMEGLASSIAVEAIFKDGTKKEAAFGIAITK